MAKQAKVIIVSFLSIRTEKNELLPSVVWKVAKCLEQKELQRFSYSLRWEVEKKEASFLLIEQDLSDEGWFAPEGLETPTLESLS